jgi:hypothetical protein
MAERKYENCIIPLEPRSLRQGEPLSVGFKAMPYGIDASWGILVATQAPDEETRKRLNENPHKHPHHQFITYFGSNPYNIGEFGAEISIFLGEEREEYIISRPTVIHFPPGVVHGYGTTPHRIDKPVYHLDMTFAHEYQRVNLPE